MKFDLQHTDKGSLARAGSITTDHGVIQTPIFMPVGTLGSVKGIHQRELEEDINADIILGNTYHLYLRPGIEILEKVGGLHKFMNWDRPILTDSGGYQVYSLSSSRKITEEGVTFQAHTDGSKQYFSPETAIDIQRSIGGDIIMAFDECTPYPCEKEYAEKSMHMTHRWAKRCIKHFDATSSIYDYQQTFAPIVQGSVYPDLRKESAKFIADLDQPINAIGGLSVGEPAPLLYEMTAMCAEILPTEKPRYLMGVGTPDNLLECIALGIDMFDCVMPTRNGRNGMLFTSEGTINIKNSKWKDDFSPIDPNLGGYNNTRYSKAYLRHLITTKELLGLQIASIHNLQFYLWLVRSAREKIIEGTFNEWKNTMIKKLVIRL